MNNKNENASMANNSSQTSTPTGAKSEAQIARDAAGIPILFGLSVKEVNDIAINYRDTIQQLSIAVNEIILNAVQDCQKTNDQTLMYAEDFIFQTRAINAITMIERFNDVDSEIIHTNYRDTSEYQETHILELHDILVGIIKCVDECGDIYDFISSATCALRAIKTRAALADFSDAFGCVINIYIAYERSKNMKSD